jgi:pyruvate/2-oxoglutarate/acetoin dehydrogenase E1 component
VSEITYLQAIHDAIDEELARDDKVFVFGEDIRQWGAPLGEMKGLFKKYGPNRVLDTPISCAGLISSTPCVSRGTCRAARLCSR